MNLRIISTLVAALVLLHGTPTLAQETLATYTQARQFTAPKTEKLLFSYTVTPHYFKSGTRFWYEYKTTEGTSWYVVDPAAARKTPLFDRDELAARLTEYTKDPFDAQHIALRGLRLEDDDQTFTFHVATSTKDTLYFDYDLRSRQLSKRAEKPVRDLPWAGISPDKKYVVYAKDLNLYRMDYADYQHLKAHPSDSIYASETQLTTDGVEDFAFGMPRNRLNTDTLLNHKRTAVGGVWSPDGKYFLASLRDNRRIKDLWVINSVAKPRPTLETYKYLMPGEKDAYVTHLYLFDVDARTRREIKTTAFADQTLGLASRPRDHADDPTVWLGTNSRLYLTRVSRDQKRVDICSYTLGADSIVPIIEERLNTYIETRPLARVDGTGELIQWSERDGWAHLYLYDADGRLKHRLTQGSWHVDRIVHVDAKARLVFFTANGREGDDTTPYYEHLYSASLDGTGRLALVTPGNYFHQITTDAAGTYFVDNFSRVNTIPATALYDRSGRKLMTLEEADFTQLQAAGYRFPEPFRVKAADGVTDLYGVMYKPFDFDSTRVYPVVNYVYPGPQTESVNYSFAPMNPRTDRLAQAGFIVVTFGQRGGHPSRSKWYHNYGYGNLRDYPLADHKAGIEQLCRIHHWMDVDRVGIHGHSGGGFMSTAAILQYPEFFKVAVSCAGNHDNNIYNNTWSEKNHGVKEITDRDGDVRFDIHVPVNQDLAKNLRGHLLLIHGDIDNNVHPAGTIRVADALIRAGKRFDMLILPGQRHGFGPYNEYFYWRMVDYFSRYLRGEQEQSIDIKDIK